MQVRYILILFFVFFLCILPDILLVNKDTGVMCMSETNSTAVLTPTLPRRCELVIGTCTVGFLQCFVTVAVGWVI